MRGGERERKGEKERESEGERETINRKRNTKAPAGTRKLETAFYARAKQMCCILLGS